MLKYIQTPDDTLTIMMPTGPIVVTRHSFNYKKIVNLLPSIDLSELEPLLTAPDLPNGVFHAYLMDEKISAIHYTDSQWEIVLNGKVDYWQDNGTFLGVYVSTDDIVQDYPEYFI